MSLCLAAVLMWGNFCAAGSAAAKISADAAVLVHDGRVLYGKNENKPMPIASTTKIMTAIVVIENSNPEDLVEILPEYCGIEGSSMYLKPGTEKSVSELLTGLMLVSGNDAALALAAHVAGNVDAFVRMMNKKAEDLGMKNTHFANPHGLSDPDHYSTAFDMAILMEYCMGNSLFSRICSTKSFNCDGAQLLNHNKLLFVCKGCTGGKTGYTMASGRCLVSSCEREGASLVCVTLSAPDDWNDHMKLYDWCYDKYSLRSVTENVSFDVPMPSGKGKVIKAIPQKSIELFVEDDASVTLDARLPWFVFEPVGKNEIAGKVSIYIDGKSAGEYYLIYSAEEI